MEDKRGWLVPFIREKGQALIEQWLNRLEARFGEGSARADLQRNGEAYLPLLLDVDVPLEEHPGFALVPHMCRYHAQKNTPLADLLASSHAWRESILQATTEYTREHGMAMDEVASALLEIHRRIDRLQEVICDFYWGYATTRIQSQEERIGQLHQDRLSLIGKMAASMAHELRNPLSAIKGLLQLARKEGPALASSRFGTYMDVIEREMDGLFRQINGFLSFSKNDGSEEASDVIELGDVVAEVTELTRARLVDDNIELKAGPLTRSLIRVQKSALQQVLINLVNNSADALEPVSAPRIIRIQTSEDERNVYLAVCDNGPGIPPGLGESIFVPFVTGKPKGTGLGLALCKQIMEKNGGGIGFTSEPGATIFTITLPKAGSETE